MSEDATRSKAGPLVIAHRCLGFGHKENSVRALQAAMASEVDGIEIDVRLTKDHKWVVIHNPFFKSEERSVVRIHDHTHAQVRREVNKLDTMLALSAAYHGEKLVFIDVKDVGEERQVVRMIQHYGLHKRAIVIAWEPEVLRRVHAIDPDILLGFSYVPIHSSLAYVKGSINKPLSRHGVLLSFNREHSFDGKFAQGKTRQHYLAHLPELPLYSIQVPAAFCSQKLVRLAHAKNMRVYPFGVSTAIGSTLLRRRGIDGFLTKHPARFL